MLWPPTWLASASVLIFVSGTAAWRPWDAAWLSPPPPPPPSYSSIFCLLSTLAVAFVLWNVVSIATYPAIKQGTLPSSGEAGAAKLKLALQTAANKHGVVVRATLFSTSLAVLYGVAMDGVPGLMLKIARSKAKACIDGKDLKNPSLGATVLFYILPWML